MLDNDVADPRVGIFERCSSFSLEPPALSPRVGNQNNNQSPSPMELRRKSIEDFQSSVTRVI